MADWIKQIIEGNKRVAMPIMTHPGIEYVGKRVVDAVTDGNVHFSAIEAIVNKFDMAACTVIMDLTVEAEAFGSKIEFAENELPHVLERLVRNGCIGPFSLAGRLYDMSEIMVAIYIEPDTITALLEKCTAFLLRYCEELKRTGVTGVIMAEPAAGLLSDEDCQTYSTKYVRQVVEALQDDTFTIVLHNCGNTGQCTQAMVDSGAAALHFGNAIDMRQALQACPTDVLVMGNIDPVGILKQSTPEVVYQKTLELLEQTASAKNYVLSTGCDVPMVPEANIQAFYQALDHFNSSF